MVILWTHSRRQDPHREEKRHSPGTGENRALTTTKNSTNEASILLKTKDGLAKRTKNELEVSAQMRAMEPKFELVDIAHVGKEKCCQVACSRHRT